MSDELNQPALPPRKIHRVRRLLASLLLTVGIAAAAYVLAPSILDQWRASQFTPSSEVAAITPQLSLTSHAKQIFYATSPEVNDSKQFNDNCQSTERTSAILGCYYRDRIYLYNIQNPELNGALEVTAAHEMLHAAYARLNIFERRSVNSLVEEEYDSIKDDPSIKEVMQYYHQKEPGDELNELHSIIGTTVQNLPDQLEKYYSRYFTNRRAIVALNQQYTSVFTKLNDEANSLQQRLKLEESTIETETAGYTADLDQLNIDIQSFNQRAQTGGFQSRGEFQVARTALVLRSDNMTARQTALNQRIAKYNDDVAELNKIAVKVNQLNSSINGVSAPGGVR